jgi:ABC-2 type transport system permease protein
MALIVVYLYSFKMLPIERAHIPSVYIKNLISFLNLGMVGFVTAAVSVRFVFPAVSLEGEAFWIIRSSPMELKEFLRANLWSRVLPLLVLAEVLIVLSNALLGVSIFMMFLGIFTVLIMTFGIAALGVGMGAIFPRFRYENAAQIPTGFGGIVFMIVTMTFIGVVVTLEAWPVYRIILSQTLGRAISGFRWAGIVGLFSTVILLDVLAVVIPLKIGLKRLLAREI